MRVLSKQTLRKFWESERRHSVAKGPLEAWHEEAKAATWKHPNDLKATYRNASVVGNGRIVFNIKGNDYRLVVSINYAIGIVYVCWVGTHEDYDKIDVETVRCT
ncbi:type II toxin-antitoxin system HigB family toxin [Aurantimonas sp. A2-1-M11]|uniref:type II toxin-antitoxin system HigB family toxin n=1 Tax=Aurantimonas sp. A2-1-M11 TaxID=3113712 RepID=UPI002F933BD1